MKTLLRAYLVTLFSLWLTSSLLPGFSYENGAQTLLFASLALGLINLLVRPLVNLIMLPINLFTLGILGWMVNVLMLYLLTVIVPAIQIHAFRFEGFDSYGLTVPSFDVAVLPSYLITSIVLAAVNGFLNWLAH